MDSPIYCPQSMARMLLETTEHYYKSPPRLPALLEWSWIGFKYGENKTTICLYKIITYFKVFLYFILLYNLKH